MKGETFLTIPVSTVLTTEIALEAEIFKKWDKGAFSDDRNIVLALWMYENFDKDYVNQLKE